jgi:hypothetical protein
MLDVLMCELVLQLGSGDEDSVEEQGEESKVANKVTSTPRATRPSVRRLVTSSQGP